MDGKVQKVPSLGLLAVPHPANAEGFTVSVPIPDPDPSLAGFPDHGPRGATSEHGRMAEEPAPWVPKPLNLTEAEMTTQLAEKQGRLQKAQAAYQQAAMLYATELGEWERGREYALTGVTDVDRRKQIVAEYEGKKSERLGSYLSMLAATETAAIRAADDLDQYSRRIAVTVKATPPQLPEALRAKASELLPILRAEVDSLPLGTLRDRLRLALIQEDDAAAYLLATLLPPRLDTRTPEAALTADGRVRFDSADDPAKSELRSLIRQTRDRFKDASLGTLAGKASSSRDKAGNLRASVTRGQRVRRGQPAPFLAAYQRLYNNAGPDIPWTAPEPPKPRPPTVALNPETGKPLKIPEGVVLD